MRGQKALEGKLWDGSAYLLSLDPATGKKNGLLLAYQFDGEWISRLHGFAGVFAQDRLHTCLETLKTLEQKSPQGVMINVVERSGSLTQFGGRMGWMCSMPASIFIVGMTVIQAGDRERGLEIARRAMDQVVNHLGMTWDMPNMVRTDRGDGQQPECMRIYGTDYYQCMSIWACRQYGGLGSCWALQTRWARHANPSRRGSKRGTICVKARNCSGSFHLARCGTGVLSTRP